jgi:hypothetical protein
MKNEFIISITLISPLEDIISKLNKFEFRDCDIKWLDKKLEKFTEFAAKTFGINTVMAQTESVKPTYMNGYAYQYYLNYFTKLLTYFRSF